MLRPPVSHFLQFLVLLSLWSNTYGAELQESSLKSVKKCLNDADKSFCVEVFHNELNFWDAESKCNSLGKSLITILTKTQQNFINELVKQYNGSHFWIGLFSALDDLHWVSKYPFIPNVFLSQHADSNEQCFTVSSDARTLLSWKSLSCDSKIGFICGEVQIPYPKDSFTVNSLLSCPRGFQLIGNSCFSLKSGIHNELSWEEASHSCASIYPGATLASVESLSYQDALSILISWSSRPVWIGLHHVDDENRWENGDQLVFTNWLPGSLVQSGKGQTGCVMMHQRPLHLGQWALTDCSNKLNYICQTRATASSQSTIKPLSILNQGFCNPGYFQFHERCMKLNIQADSMESKEIHIPDSNSQSCSIRLSPRSTDELVFMRLLMHSSNGTVDSIWSGVSLEYDSTNKWDVKTEEGTHIYPSLLPQWRNVLTGNVRICLALDRKMSILESIDCQAKLPSICGYNLSLPSTPNPSAPIASSCPAHWVNFGNKCFSTLNYPPLTWPQAQEYCSHGSTPGSLVTIHSPREAEFLNNHLGQSDYWLGLRAKREKLSANGDVSYSYYWSDSSAIDYLSLGPKQLVPHFAIGALEECFIANKRSGYWNGVSCYDRHMFICQMEVDTKTAAVEPAESPIKLCSEDTLPYCIMIFPTPATHKDAEHICRHNSMSLATVTTEKHQQFLTEQLSKLGDKTDQAYYIGLHILKHKLTWTSNYPAVSVTYWNKDLTDDVKKCTVIRKDMPNIRNWEMEDCDRALPFICSPYPSKMNEEIEYSKILTCPTGYMLLGRNCFLIRAQDEQKLSWSVAAKECSNYAKNGQLATISSLFEQDGLTALLGLQPNSVWIGLHQVNSVHMFQNDIAVFTNWKDGEPSGSDTRCTIMHHEADIVGKWSNRECNELNGYVCQTSAIPTSDGVQSSTLNALLRTGDCLPGFYMYQDTCYKLIKGSEKHRSDSDFRDELSGQCVLASGAVGSSCETKQLWGTKFCPIPTIPHTSSVLAFLRLLLRLNEPNANEAWIGLKLLSTARFSQLLSEENSTFGASHLISYSSLQNYYSRLSNNNTGKESDKKYTCVVLQKTSENLELKNCGTPNLPTFCSYSLSASTLDPKPLPKPKVNCPSNWIYFENNCYLPSELDVRVNWSQAENSCRSHGLLLSKLHNLSLESHLASVHSMEETEHLIRLIKSSAVWIGLRIFDTSAHVDPNHNSTNSLTSVNFEWSDSTEVDYILYDLNLDFEPEMQGFETCMFLDTQYKTFTGSGCFQLKNFVCKMPALESPLKSVEVKTVSSSRCFGTALPLTTPSRSACYRIFQISHDWISAEASCHNIHPQATLVSIHSLKEDTELVGLLMQYLSPGSHVWTGLYQSDFAYTWSDRSSVNYVPLSADKNKLFRHHLQDCFVLALPNSQNLSESQWKAISCQSSAPNFVCQIPYPGSTETSSTQFNGDQNKVSSCPQGYWQFRNKCFKLNTAELSWPNANAKCKEFGQSSPGFTGSLADISDPLDQQFLASMLDNMEPKQSSAWIGLFRHFTENSSDSVWSSGALPTYLRPVIREQHLAVFESDSSSRTHMYPFNNPSNIQLCTAMFRSSSPRLNGIWLQISCDEQIYLPSLCQLTSLGSQQSPPTVTKNSEKETFKCPQNFRNSVTGYGLNANFAPKLSQPVCYHIPTQTAPMTWQRAHDYCSQLSTPLYNVTLLSISSVFEVSYLRAWLSSSSSSSVATPIAGVWTALKVQNESLGNWTWSGHSNESVLYTDWIAPPGVVSGCYIFDPAPYKFDSGFFDSGLGSLRPSRSCEDLLLPICQTDALNSTLQELIVSNSMNYMGIKVRRELLKQTCSESVGYKYRTDSYCTKSGKPCIRWDLLPQELVDINWDSSQIRSRILSSDWIGGNNTLSYAENFCSFVLNKDTQTHRFGCYSSRSLTSFEECNVAMCPSSNYFPSLGKFSQSGLIFLVIVVFILIILVIGFMFMWAIPFYKRRQYRPIKRFSTRKAPSLGFIKNGELLSAANLPFDFGPPVGGSDMNDIPQADSKFNYVSNENLDDDNKPGLSLGALSFNSHMRAFGFPNPIYTPLNDDFIDDFEIDTANKQHQSVDI